MSAFYLTNCLVQAYFPFVYTVIFIIFTDHRVLSCVLVVTLPHVFGGMRWVLPYVNYRGVCGFE